MTFEADANLILAALNDFYERSVAGEGPVIHQPPMSELIANMELSALIGEGGLTGEKLARFLDEYLSGLTRFYHPANIAHQQAVPHYMAALAGLVDHFVSSDGSIYEFGPASVSLEYFLINWLLEKVGWIPAPLNPQPGGTEGHGGGILTHGGSLANLTALIAARSKIAPDVWAQGNPGNLALLAPATPWKRMPGASSSQIDCPPPMRGWRQTANRSSLSLPMPATRPPACTIPCRRSVPSAGSKACGSMWTAPTARLPF
jgi:L-2,4-diaminobutyrate decarboxylase